MPPLAEPVRHAGPIPPEVARELGPGERLLWSGQPLRGLRLRGADALLIPFSLVWCGGAIFWEASALRMDAPLFFKLWGLPFVLVGLYLVVGRFFFDAWRRARTWYAVTSERVLILSAAPGPQVTSLPLGGLREVTIQEGGSGTGTIDFGGGRPYAGLYAALEGWPGSRRHLGPRFSLVPDVRRVYEAIRAAQRQVR